MVRLGLGGVDLANDLGCDGSAAALAYPRSLLVVASRAAGLPGPVNSVYAKLDDPDGLLEHARAARAIGFGAQSALTPRQLPAIQQVFGLAAERIVWAKEVIQAFQAAGGAACRTPSGEFVDLPIAQEAERIVAAFFFFINDLTAISIFLPAGAFPIAGLSSARAHASTVPAFA